MESGSARHAGQRLSLDLPNRNANLFVYSCPQRALKVNKDVGVEESTLNKAKSFRPMSLGTM